LEHTEIPVNYIIQASTDPGTVLSMFMLSFIFVVVWGLFEWKWICEGFFYWCLISVLPSFGYLAYMWDDLITQSKYPLLKILLEKITIQNMEKLELKLF